MEKHQEWIQKWIEEGLLDGERHHRVNTWRTHVLGQCKSWIKHGLQERSMTRDLDWGIPVPLPNSEGKVLYVWLDAPIGYISATKEWATKNNQKWEDFWKRDDTKLVHFIGKDNIVFHCIIFPILLKEYGEGFILPTDVPSNAFLNIEGNKISTSRGWAIWLKDYLEDFPDQIDYLRYVLTSIAPENRDSEFTWKIFQDKINNELIDVLGNFINRVVTLIDNHFDGEVPFER